MRGGGGSAYPYLGQGQALYFIDNTEAMIPTSASSLRRVTTDKKTDVQLRSRHNHKKLHWLSERRVSRYHGSPIKSPSDAPRTSQQYRIKGFKRES